MKVRLTEAQLKKAKLIVEGEERIGVFKEKAEDIKETVNRLYSKLSFTTLAEILEGEVDLSVIRRQLERLRTIMYTHKDRVNKFFNEMSEEEFYANWDGKDIELDSLFQDITYKKIDVLDDLLKKLEEFADSDIEANFKDIRKLDL